MRKKADKAGKEVAGQSELERLRSTIVSERGEGKVRLGSQLAPICCIPTGVFLIDLALLGGFPDGKGTIIYGVESSGKTTLSLFAAAQAQRKYPDSVVVWCDTEHSWDPVWATLCGVDVDRVELLQPDFGEEAVDLVTGYLDVDQVCMVVFDSIACIIPKKQGERSAEDSGVGERARLAGILCSNILTSWSRERERGHKVSVILINQYRDDIGKSYGDPRKLPGGWQANYFARCRVQMKCHKIEGETSRGVKVTDHNEHSFALTKDKGSTLQKGMFNINLHPQNPQGLAMGAVDDYGTVITYAKKFGIVHGGGQSWKCDTIEGNRKFGKQAEIEAWLIEHPDDFLLLKQTMLADMRAEMGLPPVPPDGYLLGWVNLEA
jgi:recombination protein RecA